MAIGIPPEISDNPLYLHLYQLAREEVLNHVLEIGSGKGLGTTRILVEALKAAHASGRSPQLYCLESNPEAFAQLQASYADLPWVHCYQAYSKIPARFPSSDEVIQYYRQPGNALRRYSQNEVLEWLEAEKSAYDGANKSENHILESIRGQFVIDHFDLVLLDGSDFTSSQDLAAVDGAGIVILSGANTYKNHANYQSLNQNQQYVLIQENLTWQHGMAVFKRRHSLATGITAIVHTRNAAEHLPECLASLAWAQERIVIDMYSEDQTVSLAESLGARVARHVQVDCVDEARNWGLSLANHTWTLVLDADERIPDELARMIQELIYQPQALDGYWLPRRNFFFGQEVPFLFPDYQLRLFRTQQAYWRGIVHELPVLKGMAARFPEVPELAIQHYSYSDVRDFCQRQLRYAETLWQQMGRFPVSSMPNMAHDLRARYEAHQHNLTQLLHEQTPDNLEWLVRQLYLFSDLAMSAVMLQNSGQLGSSGGGVRLSAYSYLKNGEKFDYPYIESLLSVMEVCDELVVSYALDSEDQTTHKLQELAANHPKLRLFATNIWQTSRKDGETIRLAAEEAMAACTGDWHWHLQADEVYTRADAKSVRSLVEIYHGQSVHGFRFQVLHFYADYDTLVDTTAQEIGWYQHTIRLARAGKGRHFGDAWTMTMTSEDPAAVVNTNIRIFHYGHVREKEAMRRKSSYMEKLYHELPVDFEVCKPGTFVYDRVPEKYLITFQGTHPEAMQERIARWRIRALPAGRKLKLLIISRYHKIKKGFGITLNEIYATQQLQTHFDVQQLAWHYDDGPQKLDGIEVWPCPEPDKLVALRERLYHFEPDLILLHADAHFFISYLKELDSWRGPVVGWFTVDFERPHSPVRMMPLFKRCTRILSMADFALNQLRQDFKGPLGKVPLGVNHSLFSPAEGDHKTRLRQKLGLPQDAFVFLMVANNFWRKGLEYAVLAFSRFVARYPDRAKNTLLYLHTEQSENLNELIQAYGLKNQIRISQGFDPFRQALSDEELVELYRAADAFLLTTLGEGFGMPVLEAQACGLPLIVSDNSVLREVAGDAALFIRCPGYIGGQNADAHVWMRSPDPDHCAELMYQLQSSPDLRQKLRTAGLRQSSEMTWARTALLLTAELASSAETGTLEYLPPEPCLRAV